MNQENQDSFQFVRLHESRTFTTFPICSNEPCFANHQLGHFSIGLRVVSRSIPKFILAPFLLPGSLNHMLCISPPRLPLSSIHTTQNCPHLNINCRKSLLYVVMMILDWRGIPSYMVNHWCKVRWTIKLDGLEAVMIGFKDSLYPTAMRIVKVAILQQRKGVLG